MPDLALQPYHFASFFCYANAVVLALESVLLDLSSNTTALPFVYVGPRGRGATERGDHQGQLA